MFAFVHQRFSRRYARQTHARDDGFVPSVFVGRFGAAKGLWYTDPRLAGPSKTKGFGVPVSAPPALNAMG